MRVCDYIAQRLYDYGVKRVYGLMGGGAAGLNDGFIKNGKINFVCFHHEQGAGHAAIGEARLTNNLAVVNPTTGCGGTNCATSVLNAWQDSIPILFISGNVRLTATSAYINSTRNINLRRYGLQEHNITQTYSNMTKYSKVITHVEDVAYELDKAIHIATTGRKGPVWLDIPANIQTALMPDTYKVYQPKDETYSSKDIEFFNLLNESKRPLILVGAGIHLSNSREKFRRFVEKHQIPFVTTFAADITSGEYPLNIGAIGIKGSRHGNFAIQNCDLLIVLGSSLNNGHVGYDEKLFAPTAKKIVVDIDESELKKNTVNIDLAIHSDLSLFFDTCEPHAAIEKRSNWIEKCQHWKSIWPTYQSKYREEDNGIDLYELANALNKNMKASDIIITDAGQPYYVLPVALNFKEGQKLLISLGQADMGWALPGSIGAAMNTKDNVIAFIGDGSFYSNMQELAVAKYNNLPIKFVVGNNNGYMSIRNTQTKFYQGRVYGEGEGRGLFFPSLEKVAAAFDLDFARIDSVEKLDIDFESLIHSNKSVIIEVMLKRVQDVYPTLALLPDGSQGGLHQMFPFLSEEETQKEMIAK